MMNLSPRKHMIGALIVLTIGLSMQYTDLYYQATKDYTDSIKYEQYATEGMRLKGWYVYEESWIMMPVLFLIFLTPLYRVKLWAKWVYIIAVIAMYHLTNGFSFIGTKLAFAAFLWAGYAAYLHWKTPVHSS